MHFEKEGNVHYRNAKRNFDGTHLFSRAGREQKALHDRAEEI
jgi:hypothetical protein